MNLEQHELKIIQEALVWAYEMLWARDNMNAKVHCSPIRLSPITERIGSSLLLLEKAIKND